MPKHKYGTSGKSVKRALRSSSPENETHSTDSNSPGNEDDHGGQSSDAETEKDSDVEEFVQIVKSSSFASNNRKSEETPGTSVEVGNFVKSFGPIDQREESRMSNVLDSALELVSKFQSTKAKFKFKKKDHHEQMKDHHGQEGKDDYITLDVSSESDDEDEECTIDPNTPGPSHMKPKKMKLDRSIPRPGSVLMDSRRATEPLEDAEDRSLPCPVPCRVSGSLDQSNGISTSSEILINNRIRKRRSRENSRDVLENVRFEQSNGIPTNQPSSEVPELLSEEEENSLIFAASRRRKRTQSPISVSEIMRRALNLPPSRSINSHDQDEALEEDIEAVDQTIQDSDSIEPSDQVTPPPRVWSLIENELEDADDGAQSSSRKATNQVGQPDLSKGVREGDLQRLSSNRRKKKVRSVIASRIEESVQAQLSSSNKSPDEQNKEAQAPIDQVHKARKGPQTPTNDPETPPEVAPVNSGNDNSAANDEIAALREENAALRGKYDNLVSVLQSKVECPVCLEVPKAPPIPICPNGHVICTKCVRPTCPTCRVRMADGKSVIAVAIIDNIPHNCEFRDSGCQVNCGMTELQLHLKICPFRTVKCPNFSCTKEIALNELAEHTLERCIHTGTFKSSPLLTNYNYVIGEIHQNVMFDVRRNSTWRPDGIAFDGKNFFLKIMRKARKSMWYFYIQMAGSEEESSQYVAIVHVFKPSDNKALVGGVHSSRSVTAVCPIDISKIEMAANNGYCNLLPDTTMKQMLKEVPSRNGNDPLSKKYEFAVSVYLQRREDFQIDLEEDQAKKKKASPGTDQSKEEALLKRNEELEDVIKALKNKELKASTGIDQSKEEALHKRIEEQEDMIKALKNKELHKQKRIKKLTYKELYKSQEQGSSQENKSRNVELPRTESHSSASSSSSSGAADEEMNVGETNERIDYFEIEEEMLDLF